MNKFMSLTIGLVLAGTSLAVNAGGSSQRVALCENHIEQALGTLSRTKLYDIQSRRGGDRLRIKVYPEKGESQVLQCWVSRKGGVTLETSDGVALSLPSIDGGDQVSLSE